MSQVPRLYKKMNEAIVGILRISGDQPQLYAARRIEDLEERFRLCLVLARDALKYLQDEDYGLAEILLESWLSDDSCLFADSVLIDEGVFDECSE